MDIKETKGDNAKIYFVSALLAIIIFIIDLELPLGVAGGVPYVMVLLFTLWSSKKSITIHFAIICSVLTIIGFYFSPSGGEEWKVLTNRILALFAIWITAILTLQRKEIEKNREKYFLEKEEAFAKIKILQGIIPICAGCKNIRDDKGAWSQMELYVRENSEADFSHSMCPDCVKEHYPELECSTGKTVSAK